MTQAQMVTRLKEIKKHVEQRLERKLSMEQLFEAITVETLVDKLWPVKESLSKPAAGCSCLNIDGWSVRMGEDGYYRMYKTIDGKTQSIYLGKNLSWNKARRKIAAKEKELGFPFW